MRLKNILISLALGAMASCGNAQAPKLESPLAGPLEAQGYVSVALKKLASGHDVVSARLNGEIGDFILDTGSGFTVIDDSAVGRFSVSSTVLETDTSAGAGGQIELTVRPIDSLALGLTESAVDRLYVTDLANVLSQLGALHGAPLYGIIGQDLLVGQGAVLDVTTDTLFLQPDAQSPCLTAAASCTDTIAAQLLDQGYRALPINVLSTGHISIAAQLNGQAGSFLVDSGARASFLNLGSLETFAPDGATDLRATGQVGGAGGATNSYRLPLSSFQLVGLDVGQDQIGVIDLSAVTGEIAARGGGDIDGVIGQDVLQAHGAVIDLVELRLFLMP